MLLITVECDSCGIAEIGGDACVEINPKSFTKKDLLLGIHKLKQALSDSGWDFSGDDLCPDCFSEKKEVEKEE